MRTLTQVTLVTCLLVCLGTGCLAITCLSCGEDGRRSLSDCDSVIECDKDHTCYVEQVLSLADLSPRFKAGCRDIHHCNLIKCNIELSRNTSVSATKVPHSVGRRDLTVCTQCCYNDTCNVKGCGGQMEKIINGQKLLQCYNCPKLREGSRPCMDFTTCQAGEYCVSEYIPHGDGDPHYKLGCMKHKFCEVLKLVAIQNNSTLETKCCDEQLCNQNPYTVASTSSEVVNPLDECPKDLVQTSTTTTTQAPTTVPIKSTAKPITQSTTSTTTTTQPPKTTTVQPTTQTAQPSTTTTQPTTTTTQPTTTTTQSTTTTTQPTTTTTQSTTTTTQPTTTTTQTTTTTTQTTTTPKPTTTTTTTTKPTTAGVSKVSRQCQICDGPPEICEQAYIEDTCVYPNNYCINKLSNTQLGSRTVIRKCGNFEECQRDWYQGTSDNDRCLNFDPKYVQTLNFDCTYCCTSDNCNIPVVPDASTLYRD